MTPRITPEYLAGFFDACAVVELTHKSEWNPSISVTFKSKRKRVLEASAYATGLGVFKQVSVNGSYEFWWQFTDTADIVKLFDKIGDYVVVYADLVYAIVYWIGCQETYDALATDPRKGVMANTIERAKLAKSQAVALMVRTINDFK